MNESLTSKDGTKQPFFIRDHLAFSHQQKRVIRRRFFPTNICTVFHQQLCTGGMSLYTGSMKGRNSVQGVQIYTSALWTQHSHYRFRSKTKYPHWSGLYSRSAERTMRYEFITHDNMNPYLCNKSLQGEDSTIKGGIMNGRPVWFNIWSQKQRGLSQCCSGSIHLKVMVKLWEAVKCSVRCQQRLTAHQRVGEEHCGPTLTCRVSRCVSLLSRHFS